MKILDRRIHLVTGKGGVGRTTVAAALAEAAALNGRRVLLTEIGDPEGGPSSVGRYFGRHELGTTPERVAPGIYACRLWASAGHELFARAVIPGGPLVSAALRSKVLRRFMIAAPSFHELGVLYHFLRFLEMKDDRGAPLYNAVVVDMPATGHSLALASLPEVALRLVPRGPVADAMRRGQAFMNDPRIAAAWVVTLPEQLPITEAIELMEALRSTSVPLGGVILNRCLDDHFDPDEREAARALLAKRQLRGQLAFERIAVARESMARLVGATGAPVLTLREVQPEEGDACAVLTAALMAEMRKDAA